uniref:Uncharacterized protein LOC104219185 n=1 Tax=Nicotiana sylvestris TaxID=4096 RepID=A0A1U7W1I9_NICSY|nr:PREDICTED: uncharacterized protein LOC104219185 [Nicotiana sylvestris]
MMICPTIQKEIVEACAKETTKAIIEDLDGDYFAILVDESKDVSHKEQMALILRYVNKSGVVIERFLGIVHRMESLRQHQADKLEELLKFGEAYTGQGLNQERGLQRPGDTRWGSHFKTLDNLVVLFPSIVNVLKDMKRVLHRGVSRILITWVHHYL